MTGKVKWFDDKKGYGFITAADGKEVFVHYSAIHGHGRRTLVENEEVEFGTENSDKGIRANNVVRLNPQTI
jgi:CspA family cold shock protein